MCPIGFVRTIAQGWNRIDSYPLSEGFAPGRAWYHRRVIGETDGVGAAIGRAAAAIRTADALLLAAGAGMGVDSGLPDFRGPEGFWRAYPPLARLGLAFADIADPVWFRRDPALAWGFYGHRLHLYRDTAPHAGFAVLRGWAAGTSSFVFTSNVDGHFLRAGFAPERVVECHGSIHHLQCASGCGAPVWDASGVSVSVDPETLRAADPLPSCPRCGGIARPNLLMFDDREWDLARVQVQEAALEAWWRSVSGGRVVVVEVGAGRAVPTVRWFSERLASFGATLVRINPREPQTPPGGVGIALGGRDALERIAARLSG